MVKGFTIIREEDLPDFNGHGILLQHDRTGMKIFYFKPEKNKENYFSYIFKTPVNDDTGIAHALEHMVLQGSENYPLKNMFFHLAKKALASEMNASTAQYYTYYHVESYIPEDYFRLLDVYGDAIFFPLLDEKSFKQEVWRFDLDENKKPFINGVVYNEMSSLNKISDYSKKKYREGKLFQNSENGFNSGGDFLEIPELTRDKLADFHKEYYTPANCLLFLFGRIDLEKQLSFLEEKLLGRLPENTRESFIKDDIIPLPSMSEFQIEVPHKGLDEVIVSLNILCKDGARAEYKERDFFFDRISALLKKQLQFCNIGKIDSASQGSPKHKYFKVILSSVKNENVEKAKELILTSLEHCLDEGMDYEELHAACNKRDFEFENLKSLTNRKGLESKVTSGWIESNNIFLNIYDMKKEWEELKNKLLSYNDDDFRIMLKKYLIENPNKVFTIQVPDQDYFNKIEEKRTALLERKLKESGKSISEIEKEKIEFENFLKQDDSGLVKKLFPTLELKKLNDFDDVGLDDVEMVNGKYGPIHLFSSAQETDESVYVSILFAVDNLSKKEYQQLSWLSLFINNFGFAEMKATEVERLFMKNGLSIIEEYDFEWPGSKHGGNEIYENRHWIKFRFDCYKNNLEECLEIFKKFIYEKNFKDISERNNACDKLTETFKKTDYEKAELYARKKVNSYFSEAGAFVNESQGINQLKIKKENLAAEIDSTINNYISIYEKIINGSAVVSVFCDEKYLKDAKESVKSFIKQLEIKPLEKINGEYINKEFPETEKEVSTIITPGFSGAVVLGFKGSEYPSKEFAIEAAFLKWFNRQVLYEELRKFKGAYGCSCSISNTDNLIRIITARDPSPAKSLKIIEGCLEKMKKLDSDEEITEELVKGVILKEYAASLTEAKPIIKGKISTRRRLNGLTPEMRKIHLDNLLEASREDFIKAGKRIAENSKNLKACIVTGDETQACGEIICDLRNQE